MFKKVYQIALIVVKTLFMQIKKCASIRIAVQIIHINKIILILDASSVTLYFLVKLEIRFVKNAKLADL